MDLKLKEIIEGLSNSSGQNFFNRIVLNMGSVINADYVFIALLNEKKQTSSTIALYAKG
ncbi:MAG: hypothetical protein HQL46_14230 [Gammaproteobacteria bacterium]|nr:hypothetical protein [Gammaproteobacteria bacterium]